MPLLTSALLQKIRDIIQRRHTAFVLSTSGPRSAAEKAYLYGLASAHLEDPKARQWTGPQFLEWLKKNPTPLSNAEKAAAQTAQLSAGVYCQGLGNTVEKETGQLLIEADRRLRQELQADISDKTAAAMAARSTVKQLKTDLGHATEDWTRDLDRIAITEKHTAMQQGVADGISRKSGPDARVALVPMPGACPTCRVLNIGPDGQPRIFKLSQLMPAGFNVKKPQSQWRACLGSIHPRCGCELVRLPAGWGFNEDGEMVPGGKYGVEVPDETEKSLARVIEEEREHRDILEKAINVSQEIPKEERSAFEDARRAGLLDMPGMTQEEVWEGCCRAVLREVSHSPGVLFHKLTDRVSAGYGEDLGGRVALALAKTGALTRDTHDGFFPRLEKARKLDGRINFQGLKVSVEIGRGNHRHWRDAQGRTGTTTMLHPYGYIRGTTGADGEQIDAYVGPNPNAEFAFIVHQRKKGKDGKFSGYDEDKTMLGFDNADQAKRAYLAHFDDPAAFGSMDVLPMAEFKRRVLESSGNPVRGTPVHFPEHLGPRLVLPLPLQKAGGLLNPSASAESVMAQVMSGDATGSGPSLQVNTERKEHGRPVTLQDWAGIRAFLTAGQPRTSVIYRDPHVYEFDADNIDFVVPIDLQDGLMATTHDGLQPIERDNIERQALQTSLVPRNAANPGWEPHSGKLPDEHPAPVQVDRGQPRMHITTEMQEKKPGRYGAPENRDPDRAWAGGKGPNGPGYVVKARPRPTPALDLQKASADHKYVSKHPGHAGKWVYEYAEEHDGKVVPHATEAGGLVLKLPKGPAALGTLNHIRAKHGVDAKPFEGGTYAMLPITAAEAGAGSTHGPSPSLPKPVLHKPPPTPAQTSLVLTGPAHVLSDLPERAPSSIPANPKAAWQMQSGQTVLSGGSSGTLMGWDYAGNAAVKQDGKRVVRPFSAVQAQGAKAAPKNPAHALKPGTVREPTALQKSLVKKVLDQPLPGTGGKTARAYADWLGSRGHDVYLVGGIVRDMLAGTTPGAVKPEKEVLAGMNDVDFVASAPPSTLRSCHDAVVPGSAKWIADFAQKGCVVAQGTGVDLASLSSGGVYAKAAPQEGGGYAKPSTFDHDLEADAGRRDFTANALYYDVHNDAVIDPSGNGIADARNKVLRRLPGAEWGKNDKLAVRFWKFRARGWTGEPETTKTMVAMASAEFSAMGPKLASDVAKQIGKSGSPAKGLADFKAAMVADGAGHIYAQYIQPVETQIKAYAASFAKK